MNLLITLLVQRHYITKERLRELLYPDSSVEAFERMFERDKEELRSLGVPVETGAVDPLFDDEVGYRIRPDEFALPDIELTPEEAAVVGVAAKVWDHARMAEAATEAMRKLTAAGIEHDAQALEIVQPRLGAEEASFDIFWEAAVTRRPVTFDYARPGGSATRRHLQPWGVVRFSGRWYAVGLDTDRGAERVFRLSRVRGRPRVGDPGSFQVPEGVDLREVAARLAPTVPAVQAVVLVRPGAGHTLRRIAEVVESGVAPTGGPAGEWDRVRLTRPVGELADEVLAHGPDAYVVSPAELRDEVVARLRAVVTP
ncbi:helix-turn-helix transcriptional regulator [Nocardioides insulae]|uniref:helix-turn-helix transcriptional regulator n=1 Tax=Nocardioides insulae TaxID=394734 RepID=UPI001FE0733B|nr:WYL domain-containing protein [Nocardioides insulae]